MSGADRFVIGAARPDEAGDVAEALARSVREVAREYYAPDLVERWAREYTADRSRQLIDSPDFRLLVARAADGAIVGVGTLDVRRGRIAQCYVTGAGRGAGAQLLERLETIAREAGLTSLRLISSTGARAFYERNGYVSSGPQEWYEEDYEVFPYRKELE